MHPGGPIFFPLGGFGGGKEVPFYFQDIGVPTIFSMVPNKFPKLSMIFSQVFNEVLNLFP
jgi:hypothetical protein